MDAKRHAAVLICAAIAIGPAGCEWPNRSMKAGNPKPVTPIEKPIIVNDEGQPTVSQPVDPNEKAVQDYIDRLDSISRQAKRSRPPVQEAADAVALGSPPDGPNKATGPVANAVDSQTPQVAVNESSREPADSKQPPLQPPAGAKTSQANKAEPTAGADPSSAADPDSAAAPALEKPPVFARVTARGLRSATSDPALRAEPPPGVNAPATAAAPAESLKDALAAWLADSPDGSFAEQLDKRLVHVLREDYESARDPLTDVSDGRQRLATGIIDALIAIREGHDGDPSGAANAALRAVETLSESLRRSSDLEIPRLALCRSVDGYGRYTPVEPAVFPAGVVSEFVSYCEVRNFQSEPAANGGYQTRFSIRTTIMNRGGDTVLDIKDADVLDRCRNLRHDCFLSRVVRLPATLSPGAYAVKVTLVDKLGEKVAQSRATFQIVAGP